MYIIQREKLKLIQVMSTKTPLRLNLVSLWNYETKIASDRVRAELFFLYFHTPKIRSKEKIVRRFSRKGRRRSENRKEHISLEKKKSDSVHVEWYKGGVSL